MTLTLKCVAMPVTFLFQLALVHLLGPDSYGEYIYAFTWYVLLLPIAGLGVQEAVVRFVPEYRARGKVLELTGFIRWSGFVGVGTAIILASVGGTVVVSLRQEISPTLFTTLIVTAGVIPLGVLGSILAALLRAEERFGASQVPEQLARPLLTIAYVWIAVMWIGLPAIGPTAAWAFAASVFSSVLISIWMAVPTIKKALRQLYPVYRAREWTDAGVHFAGMALLALLRRIDILMLGVLAGTLEAGVYATAVQLSIFVEFGFSTMVVVMAPRIASLYAESKRAELQEALRMSWWVTAVVAAVAGALLVVGGRPILRIFDPVFEAGYSALVVLTATSLLRVACGPTGRLTTMTGHHRPAFRLLAISMLLNVALNAALIPVAGMIGAAFATFTSMAFWKFSGLRLVLRKIGVDPSIRGAMKRRS